MLTIITRWFRGAPLPDKVEPKPQTALGKLFENDVNRIERRKRHTIPTPFGRIDLTERHNPLDITLK